MDGVARSAIHVLTHSIDVFDLGENRNDVPSVYVHAGLHANETTGCGVLRLLLDRYAERPCPVRLRVVPHVNPLGWQTYLESGNGRFSRPNFVNWNRIFGASADPPERPTTEQALAAVLMRLSDGFDHVLDLHTPEFGWPHVYVPSLDRRLCTFDDLPHLLDGTAGPTFQAHHARRGALTSVTVELPSHRPQSMRDLGHWADRLDAEFVHIRDACRPDSEPVHGTRMIDLNAAVDGVCYTVAEPGRLCLAGRTIATILTPSDRRDDLVAEVDAIPLCYRRGSVVRAGSWAVRCATVTGSGAA